jgi:DNA-binding NtrC family response regulator/tetratricopeptide (TPR) repeat protein
MISCQSLEALRAETLSVPRQVYERAHACYVREDYGQACGLLAEALQAEPQGGDSVDGWTAAGLYALCCALDNRSDELAAIRDHLGEAAVRSRDALWIAYVWDATRAGRWSWVLAETSSRLDDPGDVEFREAAFYRYCRAHALANLGRVAEAVEDAEIARAIFLAGGDRRVVPRAENFLGILNRQLSRYELSCVWYERARASCVAFGKKAQESAALFNIGVTHYKMGLLREARRHFERSLAADPGGDMRHRRCFVNIALGNVDRIERDFPSARSRLLEACALAQDLGYRREEALSLEFLGDVLREQDKPAEARRLYDRAMAMARDTAPEGDIVMELHRRVGEALAAEGDLAGARRELAASLRLARAQGDRFEEAAVLRAEARVEARVGDLQAARKAIDAAAATARGIGARHEAALCLQAAAEIELEAGPGDAAALERAWTCATAALTYAMQVDAAWWTAEARALVDRTARLRAGAEHAASAPGGADGPVIIHTTRVMKDLVQLTDIFAASAEPVLITGETGTGKELIAERIHHNGPRADRPLVTVNVAAIPPSIFEREFFGHVRGAFSGADRDQPGYAARADGGTLFLDEIGELPLDMQPKLLRLLQDGTYQAIGDPVTRRTSVRIIAATNADLPRLVAEGRFRTDLWYRLRILELAVPTLRERPADVRPLLRHFLGLAAGAPVEPGAIFDERSLAAAEVWPWPGNVREIAMVARRALVEHRSRGAVAIELTHGGRRLLLTGGRSSARAAASVARRWSRPEHERIVEAIRCCDGNRQEAARLLGLSRSTLYRRMEKLGISRR